VSGEKWEGKTGEEQKGKENTLALGVGRQGVVKSLRLRVVPNWSERAGYGRFGRSIRRKKQKGSETSRKEVGTDTRVFRCEGETEQKMNKKGKTGWDTDRPASAHYHSRGESLQTGKRDLGEYKGEHA